MGMCASITSRGPRFDYNYTEKNTEQFIHKIRLLQQDVKAILKQREEESEAYEREMLLMAFKEAEWKRERKKLKEEVKRLKRKLEEREERVRLMEEEKVTIGRLLMVDQQLREERARRDEAVEKWKMLYLAIKNELDHLIHRTQQEEEELMEELQNELKAKDETIQVLKAKIASMEDEECKRKRELDILKQSLRIMSSKESTSPTSVVKSRSVHLTKSIIRLAFV
ncbi:hypothetical protein Cgig2_019052 [Carnegiea gigantea]|uniref:Uncharacterized protein n=1 Tax=Carnegiea gigantea TaxID=171969 RepID=A0A9Q1KDT2_9CARY|nr:hypothetical protein Cgig2_019052 [Carnegiea gigantea]